MTIVSVASSAEATVGGERLVVVLGHDVRDAKVYYLIEDHGGYDGIPPVYFMPLEGDHAGKPQLVKSIAAGLDPYEDHKRFEARLAKLKKRLAPMKVAGQSRHNDITGQHLPPALKGFALKRRRVKKKPDPDKLGDDCWVVELVAKQTKTKLAGRKRISECGPKARITAFYELGGGKLVVAVVSHKPDLWEGGYESHTLMLLRGGGSTLPRHAPK